MKLGRPLPFHQVTITDPFWSRWQDVAAGPGLKGQWQEMIATGRLENFRRVIRGEEGTHEGLLFNDSDVYKWLEGACYALALRDDSELRAMVDEAVELISKAQDQDGYINTFYQLKSKANHYWSDEGSPVENSRWSRLASDHEMYCMGHLIEASVAHKQSLHSDELLEVGLKAAQHIASIFGPEKRLGFCGHQVIELALCRLSDCTGEPQWRELAKWMIDRRGRRPSPFEPEVRDPNRLGKSKHYVDWSFEGDVYVARYLQDDKPLEDQVEPVGHSVRAVYYYTGAHEAFGEAMSPKMRNALETIWGRLIAGRTYITGGIGSSSENEGFTGDFDLPNASAYAETCAGIGLIFWAWRMAEMTGDAVKIDVLERVLYNAVLSGFSLDGSGYFYENPLESDGTQRRKSYYSCACCPPNVTRLILSLGGYVARQEGSTLTICLPIASRIKTDTFEVEIEGDWIRNSAGTIRVIKAPIGEATLRLRVPCWHGPDSSVSEGSESELESGWAQWTKEWREGDTVSFDFNPVARLVEARPEIASCRGRIEVERGVLVYCLEEADLGRPVDEFYLEGINQHLHDLDWLPYAPGLYAEGYLLQWHGHEGRWPFANEDRCVTAESCAAPLIPYFAWANRSPGTMQVWMRRSTEIGAQ